MGRCVNRTSTACLLLWIGLVARGEAQTSTLPAVADTYLRLGSPNQNQGQETVLRVQQSGSNRALVRMDQAAIAAAVGSGSLASATLELYVTGSGSWGSTGRTVDLHRVTAAWTESGATWNCADDLSPANSQPNCATQWAGGSFEADASESVLHTNTTSGRVQLNVLADVRAFLAGTSNFGWLAKLADETASGNADYGSRQGTSDRAPRLVLVVESATFDEVPPSLAITAPSPSVVINDTTPEIRIEYADGGSGVNPASLQVLVDATNITGNCTTGSASATCEPPPLAGGAHAVQVTLADQAGNAAQASRAFELLVGPGLHTVTFPAVADTDLRQGSPNQNQGSEALLRVRQSGKNRSLVRFDPAAMASALQGATLRSAHLELFIAQNGDNWGSAGRTVDAHRLTAPWTEAGATWNCASDANPGNQQADCNPQWAGGTYEAVTTASVLHTNGLSGWVGYEVTADLAAFLAGAPHHGWILKKTGEGESGLIEYRSRETLTGEIPRLVVVFETAGGEDSSPPSISGLVPANGSLLSSATPVVAASFLDAGSGVDPTSVRLVLDGVDRTAGAQVGASGLSWSPPSALPDGVHAAEIALRDNAGNEARAEWSFTTDTVPPVLRIASPGPLVEGDLTPAVIVDFSDATSGVDPATLEVEVDGTSIRSSCTVTASSALCEPPQLAEGQHAVAAEIADRAGHRATAASSFEIVLDRTPPALRIVSPSAGLVVGDATPEIVLEYSDPGSGVDLSTLSVVLDGQDLTAGCDVQLEKATCEPPPLTTGLHTLKAAIEDQRGFRAERERLFEISLQLSLVIESPVQGELTQASAVEVSGTVSPEADSVSVNDIEAILQDGVFVVADVPLHEGGNTLTAIARSEGSGIGTATVTVVRDTAAPRVVIAAPRAGLVTTSPQIAVTGEYVDPLSSNADVAPPVVKVNGFIARTELRTFFYDDLLLQPGENLIRVTVTDTAGNEGSAEVAVTLVPDAAQRIEMLLGDGQSGPTGQRLADPLVVRLRDVIGNPLPGRRVLFQVTRGGGQVAGGGEEGSKLSVATDEQGRAQVDWFLGSRAGAGNHEVTVTSAGFPGEVIFCASATVTEPRRIVRTAGDDHTGAMLAAVSASYPKPLLTQVFDEQGNPVQGVPVTYRVVSGGGSFAGTETVTEVTNGQGIASATFILGPQPGVGVNLVEAGFEGLAELPVTFAITGAVPGSEAETAVAGLVLDNQDDPVPGVTLAIEDTDLEAVSDAQGRFRIAGVPVGTVKLEVDGTTTSRPGTWPRLEFHFTTVSGVDNSLGMPIRLLPIDVAGGKLVGGPEAVVIQMKGVPGATLTVAPNSVTFPDGSRVGTVTFTQVHADKVPMIAPMGSNFTVAFTVQPPGTRFDPPAAVTLPNIGLPPGSEVDLFSFDHDIGEFLTVGTATVTPDGRLLRSNPGVGITKAGWAGGVPPPPPLTDTCHPGGCTDCVGGRPVSRCSSCQRCDGSTCKEMTIDEVKASADGEDDKRIAAKDEAVVFTAVAKGSCTNIKYDWDFGDPQSGSNSATGQSASHAYGKPGAYTAEVTARCGECGSVAPKTDEIEVIVLGSIKQAGYGGDGLHAVRQDSNAGLYSAPHWQDNSQTLDGDAADSGDRRFPVSYVKGSTIEMSLEIEAGAAFSGNAAGQIQVRGHGAGGIEFPATTANFQGDRIVANDLRAGSALPSTIDLLDPFEVSWEISLDDGGTWTDLGKTDNRVYVTLADPIDGASLYETLLDIGCRNAEGASAADDAFGRIWSDFADRSIRRKAIDGFNKEDGQVMRYWFERGDPLNVPVFTQCMLMTQMINPTPGDASLNGVGSCGAWANLLHKTASALGIPGSQVVQVQPDQTVHPEAQFFLVRDWNFGKHILPGSDNTCESTRAGDDIPSRQGMPTCMTPGRNGNLDTQVAATDVEAEGVLASLNARFPFLLFDEEDRIEFGSLFGDVADQPGAAAQLTQNPPAFFRNHFIVRRNGQIYDPSYGNGPFPDELAWERASVVGIMTVSVAQPPFPLARKKSPSAQELVFTPANLPEATFGEE